MPQHNIRQLLSEHPLVPVVTFEDLSQVVAFTEFLLNQQVRCIEVTLRNEFGLLAIQTIRKRFEKEMLVGAGTVTSEQHIMRAKDAGAQFAVSPGLTFELLEDFRANEIPFLPGVSTPSEIMFALENGLNTLKLFPANVVGGVDALKAYHAVFPSVKFCPTGGITKETSAHYLNLPNVFAVGGSWFQKEFESR